MSTTINTTVNDTASEIFGKESRRKKPWVTRNVLDLCDERRDLKKRRYEQEGAKEYRKANKRVQKALNKTQEAWIDTQCKETHACLKKKKESIPASKGSRTIQDKSGKCLTREHEILSRWT